MVALALGIASLLIEELNKIELNPRAVCPRKKNAKLYGPKREPNRMYQLAFRATDIAIFKCKDKFANFIDSLLPKEAATCPRAKIIPTYFNERPLTSIK